jgi:DNA-binding SARP family transcriptional activator
MGTLRILLFGGFWVGRDGTTLSPLQLPRSAKILLSYLLLQPNRPCSRDILASLEWGERSQDQARSCLNTALWRLRMALEPRDTPRGSYVQTTAAGDVSFNWASDHWLDLTAFEEPVRRIQKISISAIQPSHARELEKALTLYSGNLLEGWYDDWVLRERERLRTLYLGTLFRLLRYYKQQRGYEDALQYGEVLLREEPLREDIHREMMKLYMLSRQRAQAMRQYEMCRDVLAAELGIPPMEETQRLHAQIVSQSDICPDAHSHPPTIAAPATQAAADATLRNALAQLNRAMANFDEARSELQQAIVLVERFQPFEYLGENSTQSGFAT